VFVYLPVILAPFGTVFGYFWLKQSDNPDQPRRVTFKCVKPHQRRVPRGRSSNDESLQNEKTSEVIVLDKNSCFSLFILQLLRAFS